MGRTDDRWPRAGSVGHTGFTGTWIWIDVLRKRWFVVLTNRQFGDSAAQIKALRRAIGDAVVEELT